jgi:hypothetical protein
LKLTYKEKIKLAKRIELRKDIPSYVNLDWAIDALQAIKDSIPKDAFDIETSFYPEKSYGYYDSVDVDIKVDITYWIPYTEEELADRRSEAAKRAAATRKANETKRRKAEEQERLEYERLKEKFG